MVSTASIVCMAISAAIGFGIPIVLFLYFRLGKGADVLAFFVGCGVMLLFAFILESIFHSVVLSTETGKTIQNNIWLYALYGGLMAGLFEETGRFLAFKTILKRRRHNDYNALMYGAGHGGLEALVLLGITMINNISWSMMINGGNQATLIGSATGDALAQVEKNIEALQTSAPWTFLLGGVERIFAVALQISLSVLVWFAAKKKSEEHLYIIAILIHLLVDTTAAALVGAGVSVIIIEIVIGLMTAFAVFWAVNLWKLEKGEAKR